MRPGECCPRSIIELRLLHAAKAFICSQRQDVVRADPSLFHVLQREVTLPIPSVVTKVKAHRHIFIVLWQEVLNADPAGRCQHLNGGLLWSHWLEEIIISVELTQDERLRAAVEPYRRIIVILVDKIHRAEITLHILELKKELDCCHYPTRFMRAFDEFSTPTRSVPLCVKTT